MTSTRKTTQADVAYIGEGETLQQAGHRMRELGMAVLPVCGEDGRPQGIITQDMVVGSIAAGGDPKTVTVGEVTCQAPVFPGAAGWGVAHPDPVWYGTGLRIGELADAVRAAAETASRLSVTTTGPRMPAWRRRAPAAQRDGYHAA